MIETHFSTPFGTARVCSDAKARWFFLGLIVGGLAAQLPTSVLIWLNPLTWIAGASYCGIKAANYLLTLDPAVSFLIWLSLLALVYAVLRKFFVK